MVEETYTIRAIDIHMTGFTVEEMRDVLGYIRTVEAHRPSRLVYVKMDTPELSVKEAKELLREIWPP